MNRSLQLQSHHKRTRQHLSVGTLVGWLWLTMAVLPSASWSATASREVEEKRMADLITPFLEGKPNPITVGNTPEPKPEQ